MELNEKEAHCVARLLQGALFGKSYLDGCDYCKFQCARFADRTREIRQRLTEETGVDLGFMNTGLLPMSDFPHGRFLKNSSDEAKKIYRESFQWISELCDI